MDFGSIMAGCHVSACAVDVSGLQDLELGIRSEGVVSVDLVSNGNEISVTEQTRFYDSVLERVAARPG